MLDKTKLSGDVWVRMLWLPRDGGGQAERPFALIQDRNRFWAGIALGVIAFLVAASFLLLNDSLIAGLIVLLLVIGGNRVAAGGKAGYYEVRSDGTLGAFLGKRIPLAAKHMERVKPYERPA
ncbi:MAG: hypothetical protein E6I88_14825 [Chloroflexi bacterium]|nr:MAG: hypothetical protein E6I88_14825 [Chloroflexota bacterium]